MALLSAIVAWCLKNRPVVLVATLLFMLLGVRAAISLPIDAVPDVTNVQVQIITSAPALPPVEVEKVVTIPVERAMAGIPRTTEVRSISKYGLSVVTVAFEEGTDIYFARQQVSERLREAEDAVPRAYGRPEMGPISSGLGEIFQFSVHNDALTVMQLEELLDWHIGPLLRSVPGVVEVNSFGGEDKQYQVLLDPKRLQAAGLSIAQVVDALERSNANAGGGYIEHAREHFVIGAEGLVKDTDDLRRVVVGATPQGVPITIETVGDVRLGPRLRRGAASQDGKGETVVGVVLMLMGENSRTVTEAVKAKLVEIQPSLPEGTTIEPFYDRSVLVDRTIRTVVKNLVEGALLVIAVLFLLLGDLRAGIVVAITIPLSLLFAVIAMRALGLSGNLMSLGAIDFGLIVDGAVIIVENAVRRLSEARARAGRELTGAERVETVQAATVEVRSASVFGEAIIAIVYLPLLALTGVEGKLFRPMATTVLLALLGAFVLSLTLVPVLTSYLVRPAAAERETWLLRKAHALFRPALGFALRRRWVVISAAVALLAGGAALSTRVGAEFVPQLDEGDLLVEARRLPGVALSESVATDLRLQKAILTVPEVAAVVSKTGAPELATDPMGIEASDVYVRLKERDTWRDGVQKEDLAREISEAIEVAVPEVAGGISQPIQMRTNELVAGVRSDVAVLLYGTSLEELSRLGAEVARVLRTIPGAEDVRVEQVSGLRYLRVVPDRRRLARYGLTIEDVNQVTETMAVGHGVGEVLEGERRFGIVVKTSHGFSGDLDALRALPLKAVTGQVVPLGDVAEVAFSTGARAGEPRGAVAPDHGRDERARARPALGGGRGAGRGRARGEGAGGLPGGVGRAVPALHGGEGAARRGGAARARAHPVPALDGVPVDAGGAAHLPQRAVRGGGRDLRAVAAGDPVLDLGGRGVHRAVRRRGAQRPRARVVRAPPRGARRVAAGGHPGGRGDAAAAGADDGARGVARLLADGALDGSGGRGAAAAGHRRDRRPRQRDAAHALRLADRVRARGAARAAKRR